MNFSIPVHPRVRGEHGRRQSCTFARCGSSPRARGTQPKTAWAQPKPRFIPACAGNTAASHNNGTGITVHPRVRGEHTLTSAAGRGPDGSSPRARGTPFAQKEAVKKIRFIPACAGNTMRMVNMSESSTVHPRVRGEHSPTVQATVYLFGSSPRARGTRHTIASNGSFDRFIPACAGNTLPPFGASISLAVHPRVRGEHRSAAESDDFPPGSSPRARGTQNGPARGRAGCRFIPACAGNTFIVHWCRLLITVHPRVRGEHPDPLQSALGAAGSSPRARGTRARQLQILHKIRFIPACAGNTGAVKLLIPLAAVHPRVRGEHLTSFVPSVVSTGSSPRARGTQM